MESILLILNCYRMGELCASYFSKNTYLKASFKENMFKLCLSKNINETVIRQPKHYPYPLLERG